MPRKIRGRPVAYGPAQLRALDKHFCARNILTFGFRATRTSCQMKVIRSGKDGTLISTWSNFHMAVLDETDFRVSAKQTASALTQIGVRSVQRRFEDGSRRRIYKAPLPEGAWCHHVAAR